MEPEHPNECPGHIMQVRWYAAYLPQQCLYFLPEPQGQGSFLPTFGVVRTTWTFSGLLLAPIGDRLCRKEAMEL